MFTKHGRNQHTIFRFGTYSARVRNRKALAVTETELKVIAVAASIGLSKIPGSVSDLAAIGPYPEAFQYFIFLHSRSRTLPAATLGNKLGEF